MADPAQRRLYIVMDDAGEPVKAFWTEPRALAFIAGCATRATYAVLSVLLAEETTEPTREDPDADDLRTDV